MNARIAFAVYFLALMTLLGGTAVFAFLTRHPWAVISPDVPAIFSFKEIYPFDDATENPNFLCPYSDTVYRYKSAINLNLTRINPLSKPFYRLIRKLDDITGDPYILNGAKPIVQLSNGYYTYVFPYEDTSDSWKRMQDWAVWLKNRNIPLLQILPATKMDDRITEFPPGIPHGYSQMIEQYKGFLTENQIPYFETTDFLLANNDCFYFWFYKTDHHWNVYAGRLIAEAIAEKLNNEYKIKTDADAIKEENFTLTTYPSILQGSLTFRTEEELEDFAIFYLQKESSFHLTIPSKGIDRIGGFNDTLIAKPYLELSNPYPAFFYGDRPLVQVENKTCSNGTRVLMIKHSQADVLCPYLACAVQYLDVIDPRHFDGNIKAFIEQTKPNIVLICI